MIPSHGPAILQASLPSLASKPAHSHHREEPLLPSIGPAMRKTKENSTAGAPLQTSPPRPPKSTPLMIPSSLGTGSGGGSLPEEQGSKPSADNRASRHITQTLTRARGTPAAAGSLPSKLPPAKARKLKGKPEEVGTGSVYGRVPVAEAAAKGAPYLIGGDEDVVASPAVRARVSSGPASAPERPSRTTVNEGSAAGPELAMSPAAVGGMKRGRSSADASQSEGQQITTVTFSLELEYGPKPFN